MIINTSQVEMVLNNKAITAYSLEAETELGTIATVYISEKVWDVA